MSDQSTRFAAESSASLAQENELLRAALADAQRRIEQLEALAEGDALTGLANARRFAQEVERVAGHAARHGTPAALISFELKGIEAIVARHGEPVGQAAIAQVARTLGGLIRATDQLARTDEVGFGLLVDHLDQNSAIETGERLARCIARAPLDLAGAQIPLEVIVATTGIMPGDEAGAVLARAARNLSRAREEA
ncbi:diguanylate cyclase [Sphingomonas parva]|uniref:Diguanylate cyclase n=1 Tax=Sphingomonas parva TaxID=2555898 RepID=A0A4Y8ZX39_9SPHN|nr:diguanylate cyclase [Sphingomonas parva]TFI59962.1 diguanylate cyclase [Sphingomonas parva]